MRQQKVIVRTKKAVDKQIIEQKDEEACVKYQAQNSQQIIGGSNKYRELVLKTDLKPLLSHEVNSKL